MKHFMSILLGIFFLIFFTSCKDSSTNPTNPGKISGKILNGKTLDVITGVQITTIPATNSILNSDNGSFILNNIAEGNYIIYATKYGYNSNFVNIKVISGKTTEAVILLYDLETTNNPPEIPNLISPTDNAVVPPEEVNFIWTCSDKDNNQLKYTVLLSKNNPPTTVIADNISKTDFILINLDTASTYYWKVIAKDNYTFSESEVKSFNVKKGAIYIPPELILYYSFDNNNANDESSNGNNGTLMNNPQFVAGKKNNALQIDGSNGEIVQLPMLNFENMSEFTISIWINQQEQLQSGGEAYIFWGLHSNCWVGIGNFLNTDTKQMQVAFNSGLIGAGIGTNQLMVNYLPEYSNNWVHYALVYKNESISGYINGILVGTKKQYIDAIPQYGGIGKHWWIYSGELRFSNGVKMIVDDVRIYKNALNDEQVKALAK